MPALRPAMSGPFQCGERKRTPMTEPRKRKRKNDLSNILLSPNSRMRSRPIYFATPGKLGRDLAPLTAAQRAWLHSTGWQAEAGSVALLPGEDGHLAGAVLGLGSKGDGENPAFLAGGLSRALPPGAYHFTEGLTDPELAVVAWLMGLYRYSRFSRNHERGPRHLRLPENVDEARVLRIVNAVTLGRDLINTPANHLGPAELADAIRHLSDTHGADVTVISGEALLTEGFPLVHAVGRASDRAPCLIDLRWGEETDPKVTLVGKGICFDTGGLNLKPDKAMALMKKDMGGAATAIALAAMIMSAALPIRLRLIVPAADNSIAGNAFRPGDVYPSRKGITVEIGHTDAEGRLVLADALALADEEKPDLLVNFATLTGAARVALGPDLPPFFTDNERLATELATAAKRVADPLWRLPFWKPYDSQLAGKVADINHISDSPFAQAIIAALFLKRFVTRTRNFVHLDIYGWVPKDRPGRPRGGEPQGARAVFAYLQNRFGTH